jgi:hypothetical protein
MNGSHEFPLSNPQEQGPENTRRKPPREGCENDHQEQPEQHNKALRNNAESSIQTKEVHVDAKSAPHAKQIASREELA